MNNIKHFLNQHKSISKCKPKRIQDTVYTRVQENQKSMRRASLFILTLLVLAVLHACDLAPPPSEQPPPTEAIETPQKELEPTEEPAEAGPTQIGEGRVESIESISNEETAGRILSVQVTNPTDAEIVVTIPCGLIFEPSPESDEQRLMVIQQASATLAPKQSTILNPYVICIDSSRAVPEFGSTYQVGTMASSDLLKLAQCICNETLVDAETDPMGFVDQFGLQFAIWTVSDELSFDDMFEGMDEAEGALGQIGVEGFPEEMRDMIESFMESFRQFGQDWLDKCDIAVTP